MPALPSHPEACAPSSGWSTPAAQSRPRRLAMPTLTVWSNLPPEAQRPMVSLWSDLLRRRLSGRLASKETLHDPFAQDRRPSSAAAGNRLHPPVHTQAGRSTTRRAPAASTRWPSGPGSWAGRRRRSGSSTRTSACPATSSRQRTGFQKLVAEVGLGHVGLVLGIEVSRLARLHSDWHRLLEICALSSAP